MSFAHERHQPPAKKIKHADIACASHHGRRLCRGDVEPGNKTGQVRQAKYLGQELNWEMQCESAAHEAKDILLSKPNGAVQQHSGVVLEIRFGFRPTAVFELDIFIKLLD